MVIDFLMTDHTELTEKFNEKDLPYMVKSGRYFRTKFLKKVSW